MERPDLYVVARFLEKLAVRGGTMRKTHLQMAVGMNYDIYTKYLSWLVFKEMVSLNDEEGGTQSVDLTEKGWRTYEELLSMLERIVGSRT
jgi:predicted transcriptional regulator